MTAEFIEKLKQYLEEYIEIEESLEKLADLDRALEEEKTKLIDFKLERIKIAAERIG